MKKNKTKLELKTNTVRVLQGHELTEIVGGAPTQDCSNTPTCTTSDPPDHTPGSHRPPGQHTRH